MGISTTTA